MPKTFAMLRGALAAKNMDQGYLAEKMERSPYYISRRFCAHEPWTQDDQYFLMDLLDIPYEQMHLYFPKDGIQKEQKPRRQPVLRVMMRDVR